MEKETIEPKKSTYDIIVAIVFILVPYVYAFVYSSVIALLVGAIFSLLWIDETVKAVNKTRAYEQKKREASQ